MKKYLNTAVIFVLAVFAAAYAGSLSGDYMSELSGGGFGAFSATYNADKSMLTIEVLSLNTDSDTVDVRIIAGISGTENFLLLKKISIHVDSSVQIPLTREKVASYDRLGIELADNPVLGDGSLFELGAMPGNAEAND